MIMNSRILLMVFATCAFASIPLNAQTRQRVQFTQHSDRDLGRYEFGGYVSSCHPLSLRNVELVRRFIYTHFVSRTKGYIVSMSCTREGDAGYMTYFIEPDQQGVWRIAANFDRELRDRWSPYRVRERQSRAYIAYSVEKVSDDKVPCVFTGLPPCSTESKSDELNYRLRLLDRNGKLMWEI